MHTSKRGSSGILITSPKMICKGEGQSVLSHMHPVLPKLALSFFSSGVPWTRFVSSAAIRGSISTAVQALHALRIIVVKFPVPMWYRKSVYVSHAVRAEL
jgi:hypothetical protein